MVSVGPETAADQVLSVNSLQMDHSESIEQAPSASAVPSDGGDIVVDTQLEKKNRVPRRVLHFSDGTIEEYSTDEDGGDEDQVDSSDSKLVKLRAIDPKDLTFVPWAWYWMRVASYSALEKLSVFGEKLSYGLGITSPKYYYELEEHFAVKKREEEDKKRHDLESAGWISPDAALNSNDPAVHQTESATVSDQPIRNLS